MNHMIEIKGGGYKEDKDTQKKKKKKSREKERSEQ